MFNRTPMGRYHVMVCGTTPCMLCGSRTISAAIKQHLSIDYGQTTKVRLQGPSGWICLAASSMDRRPGSGVPCTPPVVNSTLARARPVGFCELPSWLRTPST